MKKNMKYLIVALAVIVVLGGGLTAMMLMPPSSSESESETSSSSEVEEAVNVLSVETADVESVYIKNPSGEMKIIQTSEINTNDEGEELEGFTYAFEGYENYDAATAVLTSVQALYTINANKEIGTVEDLSVYGLDGGEETVEVNINLKDGTTTTFLVGIAGGETSGNYVLYNDIVYIAYLSDFVFSKVEENVITPNYNYALTDDLGQSIIPTMEYFAISGHNFEVPLTVGIDPKSQNYVITTEGYEGILADFSLTGELPTALQTFSVDGVAVLNATEADIEAYGLSNPYVTFEYSLNSIVHTLSLSDQTVDGNRYLIYDGDLSTIYYLSDDSTALWRDLTPMSLRSTIIFMPTIMDVEKLEMNVQGQESVIDFTKIVDEEKSTEDSVSYDYTTKLDSVDIEYDHVTGYYLTVISTPALNLEVLESEEEAEISYKYTYYDGSSDTYSFHKTADDTRYVAKVNGVYRAVVSTSNIDLLVNGFEEIHTLQDADLAEAEASSEESESSETEE